MKIVAYCFGAFPLFFVEAVKLSKDILWLAIIPSYHHRAILEKSLGKENVFYLQDHLNHEMSKEVNREELINYPGAIFRDIAADKVVMKTLDKDYQFKNAFHTYRCYKQFLQKVKPDAVFFSIIETHDAMILYKICIELGIEVILYVNNRNFGGSFFSSEYFGGLPSYIKTTPLDKTCFNKAKSFVSEFRKNFKSPDIIVSPPKEEDKLNWSKPTFISRSYKYLDCLINNREPHHITESTFYQKIKMNLFHLNNKLIYLRGIRSKKYFDIFNINQLPKKFIYYPLQLTPESSINTPAPFFFDQLRAIDLLLYNMPSDHLLVVKEHPVSFGLRPFSFYDSLKKRPGVVFADAFIPSIQITKKAALTVSVTGTACLEAFLLGLPSMHFGKTFFTDQISFASHINLENDLASAMFNRPSDEKIIDFTARVFMASKDFIIFDPTDPYRDANLIINKKNILSFLDSFNLHIKEISKYKKVSIS